MELITDIKDVKPEDRIKFEEYIYIVKNIKRHEHTNEIILELQNGGYISESDIKNGIYYKLEVKKKMPERQEITEVMWCNRCGQYSIPEIRLVGILGQKKTMLFSLRSFWTFKKICTR